MYADDSCVMSKFNDIDNLILSLNQELVKVSKMLTDKHLTLELIKK